MISIFRNNRGLEAFVTMCAETGVSFNKALDGLLENYSAAISEKGLGLDSAVLLRFHVSDAHTQAADLYARMKGFCDNTLVSVVQQPPASGSKVALEAYHICSEADALSKHSNGTGLLVSHGPYKSLWGELLPQDSNCSPYNQTGGILNSLSLAMKEYDGNVRDNVIRTWFYVRDIDNNYAGMVDARRDWFAEVGMTPETH